MHRLVLLLRASLLVGLLACDIGVFSSTSTPAVGLQVTPAVVEVEPGTSQHVTIAAWRRGGFSGPVTLTLSAVPAGVSAQFSPRVIPAGESVSVLTFAVDPTVTLGRYDLVLTATGDGIEPATAEVSLYVVVF